jgi:hypothetical protein
MISDPMLTLFFLLILDWIFNMSASFIFSISSVENKFFSKLVFQSSVDMYKHVI